MKNYQNRLTHTLAAATIAVVAAMSSVSAFAVYDDTDTAIIEQHIATMMASMDSQDVAPIIDMMSPKILEQFAEMTGLSTVEVREMLITQSNAMMQTLAEDSSSMVYFANLENAKVMQTETGRDYVLIPTESHMQMDDIVLDMTGTLLALEDGDRWYMLRIDNQMHLSMLNDAYADMKDIEIFEPTIQMYEMVDGVKQTVTL